MKCDMGGYLGRRLIQLIPVMWLVGTIVFIIFRLVPGDPAELRLGPEATEESLAALRKLMGIDRPMHEQYYLWVLGMFKGDLGHSFLSQEPVLHLVLEKVPATAQLAIFAMLLGTMVGIPVGIVSAVKQNTWMDNIARTLSLFGFSTPHYWLAIILVGVFALNLKMLPVAGYTPFFEDPVANLKFACLPAFTLGMPIAAVQVRFLRSSMLETIRQDYVLTARSKGLGERIVILRHALRNALIPFISIMGLEAGSLLGGSVIVEQIFIWPGVGWLVIQSITARDYPVVQGAVLLSALVFVTINFLVDLLYSVVDPRIRLK